MKRYLIIPLFLNWSLSGTCQQNKSTLLRAYQTNSQTKATAFFTNWATETQSLIYKSTLEKNDTLVNLKNVFKSVYDSIFISPEITKGNLPYFILPNEIEYEFTNISNNDYFTESTFLYTSDGQIDYLPNNKTYSLKNFVPIIKTNSSHYLLLTAEYDSLFSNFLGDKKYFCYYQGQDIGTVPLSIIVNSQNETKRRLGFLNKYMKLPYNEDFTSKWNLSSYPNITRIIFANGFKQAWADINFGGSGGLAFLEKISGSWVLVKIKETWIE